MSILSIPKQLSVPTAAAAFLLAAVAPRAQVDTINVLTGYEYQQGFELMFDGSDAAAFRNQFANYSQNNTTNTNLHSGWTVNSTLTDPDQPGAVFGAIVNGSANLDIRTRRTYRDFDWRFEYRNSGNQGVFYRFDVSGQYAWNTGIEYAIDNNVTQSTQKFRAGAAYDLFAPSSQEYLLRSTNRWNSLRIVAKGDSVEHWMNGVKVVAFRYWSQTFSDAYQQSKWTGFNRFCQTAPNNRTFIPEGYLGLQGDHGGAWQIRRMRILHDSLPGMNRVQFGPVDTTTPSSVNPALRGAAGGHRVERVAGRLNVVSSGEVLRAVELRGVDGRLARRETTAEGALQHAMDLGGLRHGLYLVRIESASGAHTSRVVLH